MQFGEFSIQGNGSVFDLASSGNHTVKSSFFYMGYYNRSATLKGGIWDMSGVFSVANNYGAYSSSVTLQQNCLVTNATLVRLSYRTANNTLKITDGSHVYAKGAALAYYATNGPASRALLEVSSGGVLTLLSGNFLDATGCESADLVLADTTNRVVITGAGSRIVCPKTLVSGDPRGFVIGNSYGRNTLEVSDGGELVAPYRFALGYSANAQVNRAVFETNAKFTLRDAIIGESRSCSNTLAFCSGATGTIVDGIRVGGWFAASSENVVILSNATLVVTGPFAFGSPKDGVDVSTVANNGLVVQGDNPSLSATSRLGFRNRSYFRIEVPEGGYEGGRIPVSPDDLLLDATSRLEVVLPDGQNAAGDYVLVHTASGITIPAAVLTAAQTSVATQSAGRAKLRVSQDGKDLILHVKQGMALWVK